MSAVIETGNNSSIFRAFEDLAAEAPHVPAIFEADLVITRGDLLQAARRFAGDLTAAGLRSGHVVAIQMRNSHELIATLAAALQLGLTILPIDRDARASEIEGIVGQFGARALIRKGPGTETIEIAPTGNGSFPPHRDVALIKLTSGSTGAPRGVLTTERNLIADCRNICRTMKIRPDDINLGAIPFSHSYGFSNLITPLLLQGTAVVASNDYMPLSLIELANHHGVTFVPGIPMIYDHLSRLPSDGDGFRTVRTFISAGAPLSPVIARSFRERHGQPIHSFYGCSECGGISYDRLGGAAERGTVGSPMKDVRVAVDPDSGRLRVESDAVALGYLNATDEEIAKFHSGAFLTDDLVERTNDGEIRITGRSNALINVAGKKVNPREVENVILQIDGVREVTVVGSPGGARGEIVTAAVVAKPGVTREMIRERCQSSLSPHKIPRVVKLLDEMPVDERGKVKKSKLV